MILCHGSYYFKHGNPEYVTIPEKLKYVNKITYPPFGLYNLIPNVKCVKEGVMNTCENICSYNNLTSPEVLIKSLECDVQVLEQQRKRFNIRQQYKDQHGDEPERNFNARCHYKILFNREDQLYQNIIYSSNNPENNVPIIQKSFAVLKTDENKEWNIYVAFQQNGYLNQGEKILNSDKYIEFLKSNKRSHIQNFFSETSLTQGGITTQKLLEFAAYCNYENVVIIDYSCDSCNDENGKPISRDIVMKIRDLIVSGQIGRGYKNTRKPNPSNNLRKYKKTRENKRRRKNKTQRKNKKQKHH